MRIDDDKKFMARALELAANGMGHTRPNPMVGAVLVKDGEIIGEGWHEFYLSLIHISEPTRPY